MMTVITEERIEQLVREALKAHHISEGVDSIDVDIFLTPEGVLAEVLLPDASALDRARRAVDSVEQQLAGEGISLLPTVRALWQVEEVRKVEIASPSGVPQDLIGALFKGNLQSGTRQQEVWVAVTPSAQRVLRPLTTNNRDWVGLIRAFLAHRLSIGGAGHWDPIRQPRQELDEAAARYLRWRPYEQLKTTIDDVFNPTIGTSEESVKRFVKIVNFGRGTRKIHRFLDVLEDLPGPGGSFRPGEILPTTNQELYEMLLNSEKGDLQIYYGEQLAKAERDFPNLKSQFPSAFN